MLSAKVPAVIITHYEIPTQYLIDSLIVVVGVRLRQYLGPAADRCLCFEKSDSVFTTSANLSLLQHSSTVNTVFEVLK